MVDDQRAYLDMGCSKNNCIPKIMNFNRVFHYKPSILGYPYFWKHPYVNQWILQSITLSPIVMKVENHPKKKEPNIGGTPIFH